LKNAGLNWRGEVAKFGSVKDTVKCDEFGIVEEGIVSGFIEGYLD
jgi:hypothetical protein